MVVSVLESELELEVRAGAVCASRRSEGLQMDHLTMLNLDVTAMVDRRLGKAAGLRGVAFVLPEAEGVVDRSMAGVPSEPVMVGEPGSDF